MQPIFRSRSEPSHSRLSLFLLLLALLHHQIDCHFQGQPCQHLSQLLTRPMIGWRFNDNGPPPLGFAPYGVFIPRWIRPRFLGRPPLGRHPAVLPEDETKQPTLCARYTSPGGCEQGRFTIANIISIILSRRFGIADDIDFTVPDWGPVTLG